MNIALEAAFDVILIPVRRQDGNDVVHLFTFQPHFFKKGNIASLFAVCMENG